MSARQDYTAVRSRLASATADCGQAMGFGFDGFHCGVSESR